MSAIWHGIKFLFLCIAAFALALGVLTLFGLAEVYLV